MSSDIWMVLTSTVNRGCCLASSARIRGSAISITARTNSQLPGHFAAFRGQPFEQLANIGECWFDTGEKSLPRSVKETLRVGRANNGMASRSSTPRTA
jgi:hypothetical protein